MFSQSATYVIPNNVQGILYISEGFPGTDLRAIVTRPPPGQIECFIRCVPEYPTVH